MGVVQTHLAKGHSFGVAQGHQDVAFLDGRVALGKVGVAAERPPHRVLAQQRLPQAVPGHDGRVAEVADAAAKLGAESVSVQPAEALEASPVA